MKRAHKNIPNLEIAAFKYKQDCTKICSFDLTTTKENTGVI